MKGITLWQPWASLIAIGAKCYETRAWTTPYRGLVAIHASKTTPGVCWNLRWQEPFRSVLQDAGLQSRSDLPCGAILAVAELVDIASTKLIRDRLSDQERAFGDYRDGRKAWRLERIRRLDTPVRCSGAMGLWTVPAAALAQLEANSLSSR